MHKSEHCLINYKAFKCLYVFVFFIFLCVDEIFIFHEQNIKHNPNTKAANITFENLV